MAASLSFSYAASGTACKAVQRVLPAACATAHLQVTAWRVRSAYVDLGQVARARRAGRVTDAAVQGVLRGLQEPLRGPVSVWAWEEGGKRARLTVRPTGGR